MDILGIGFPELILIFLIALMVFGPRRLPELAAKLGKTVADLRNMSQGLLTEWQREITVATRIEELEKTRQEFDQIKQDLKQAQRDLKAETSTQVEELQKTRQELEEATRTLESSAQDPPAESSAQVENAIEPASVPVSPVPPTVPSTETVNE